MSADPYEENHRKRRRNRMRVSCLNCYASKRKCDRKRPCSRCTKHGLTGLCVYELDDPDARDPSLDEKTHLRNRIAELESVIRELNNRPHPRWFTSSGTEHLPDLVAVRRSSTTSINTDISNSTVATSTASVNSNPTPRKASLRARTLSSTFKSQEERVSGIIKTGMKRKYEDDDSKETRNTSVPFVNAFFASKNRSKGPRGKAGRKGHHSDASYLTDDDDDDDYEEEEPHSSFRNAHRRVSHVPAKRESKEETAYTFPSKRNSSRLDSRNNTSPESVTIASSGPASRSTSISGLFSPHKDNNNDAGNSPLSPVTPLLPVGQCQVQAAAVESKVDNSTCQSALGLTFDGDDSCSNAQPQPQAEDWDDIDGPEAKPYPLRKDVVWSDDDEDCTNLDKITPAIRNPTKRVVKLTFKAKEAGTGKFPKKKLLNKKPANGSSIGRVDNVEDKICSNPVSPTLCAHLTGTTNCNDLASFIKALGDASRVLRSAHEIPKEKAECELFKRIIGLDDYISSIGNVDQTQTDEHPLPDVVIPNIEDSSLHVPGTRLEGHAPLDVETQNKPPLSPKTSIKIASLPYSAASATNKKGSNRRRRKKARISMEEPPKSSTTTVVPDSITVKVPNIPAAPLSPAPTPASILARSALQQQSKEREAALPSTVTLATILAATTGSGPSQQFTTPPRLMTTPGPTVLPTPTLSPSSPLVRSVNAAIRRPDADYLPFYSNHNQFNTGENDAAAAAEREYHSQQQGRALIGSFIQRPAGPDLTERKRQDHPTRCSVEIDASTLPLDAFTFSPLLNLDGAKIGEMKNPSSTVIMPIVPNTKEAARNTAALGVDEGMDLDVDAEGEPAPESGYEYGYFDDGYRYECVWVGDT